MLLVELWKQGLLQRLGREFLRWAVLWGREGGWAGRASRVCDLQTLRAPGCEIHSVDILKFLRSLEQGTPRLQKALQILYLVRSV